jgi:hypothetical protein
MSKVAFVPRLMRSLALAGLLGCATAPASETDNFTVRHWSIPDVAGPLNRRTNELLDEAIAQANARPELPLGLDRLVGDPGCNLARLYAAINDRMGGPLVGALEEYANNSAALPQRRLTRRESVYHAFRIFEAPSLGGEIGRLAAVVNLNGQLIGADKLGHFFSQGYAYFEKAYLQGYGLDAALDYGEWSERTYYGALLTGVYSYADLAANFDGMRFWIHLLKENPDPLGEDGRMPYVSCFQQHWVKNRDFDWKAYVDSAWDEAVNCNLFRNRQLAAKVRRAIKALERRYGEPLGCPVSRRSERSLRAKYGPYYDRLVTLEGHGVISALPWLTSLASGEDAAP